MAKSLKQVTFSLEVAMVDYPDNWDQLRKQVYRRDGWNCQKCGANNVQVHAHHVVPLSQGGSNELSNLVTLCRNCHCEVHPLTSIWWTKWAEENPRLNMLKNLIELIIVFVIILVIVLALLAEYGIIFK